MYVCICNRVTDRDIRRAADHGARTLDDLKQSLRLATCCGRCAPLAETVLDAALGEITQASLIPAAA